MDSSAETAARPGGRQLASSREPAVCPRPGHRGGNQPRRFRLRRQTRAARHPFQCAGASGHRAHRPVRLRQEHPAALLQPHERRHSGRPHHPRTDPRRRASTSTTAISTSSTCAGGSAWSSKSPIRFQNRSTKMSPTACASPGEKSKAVLDEAVERSLRAAALWDECKDRLGPKRLRPLRRPAAAALHRPRHRRPARSPPHGRAVLRPRPHRHPQNRGTHHQNSKQNSPSSS